MIQGGEADPDETIHWSEGAFSDYRGFSPASEFFENRLWFAGSKDEPADLFASVFGEIYNFLPGSLSTDAIKRTIDSPEEPKWLEAKRYLFLGTAGTAVSIRSADRDSLITQNNITTLVENAYGSAKLQAEVANDVIVYVQRDGLKVRELVFDSGQDSFVGNDLNIISEDITESGIKEMFLQKEPNQYIWCIKENGDACVMTYERGQDVRGWANITTDGEFFSGAAIHDSGEDIVWVCVKRNDKYCIEKFNLRKDLDWYVDSGKELDGGAAVDADSIANTNDLFEVTKTSHGLSDDDTIFVTNTNNSILDSNVFKVANATTDTFTLKTISDVDINVSPPSQITVSGFTGSSSYANGVYNKQGSLINGKPAYVNGDNIIKYTGTQWQINDDDVPGTFAFHLDDTDLPPKSGWTLGGIFDGITPAGTPALSYTDPVKIPSTLTYQKVYNEVTGLDHINGDTVQVVGDGNFIEETTVTNNKITTDQYYNTLLVGLPYTSMLRPMPIEPNLVNKLSQSRVKATSKIIVRFFKTKGAKVGEAGRQLTTFPVVDTQDPTGQAVSLKTGQQRFFVGSDYEREKLIEVRQDLPYPMTVLSIASHVNAEGA